VNKLHEKVQEKDCQQKQGNKNMAADDRLHESGISMPKRGVLGHPEDENPVDPLDKIIQNGPEITANRIQPITMPTMCISVSMSILILHGCLYV
jgi:hypothetical protein